MDATTRGVPWRTLFRWLDWLGVIPLAVGPYRPQPYKDRPTRGMHVGLVGASSGVRHRFSNFFDTTRSGLVVGHIKYSYMATETPGSIMKDSLQSFFCGQEFYANLTLEVQG